MSTRLWQSGRLVPVGLLCAVGMAFFTCSAAASAIPLRQRASAAYHHAEQLRAALESRPQPGRNSYTNVIRAFRLVYHIDPGYPGTPSALAAAAEIYQEMGRRFADDRYYSKAIEAYQFLITQYPFARLSGDALFTIAEIYRTGIENPPAARAAYQEYLKKYPQAEKASVARQEIARISQQLAKSAAVPSERAREPARGALSEVSQTPASVLQTSANRIEDVTGIRQWVGQNYTRVVIRLAGPVKFNAIHLSKPARLVFDLSNTQISPDLARKVFPVESGFLQRVRIAQFQPTVTRVVLDVPEIEDYSVFSLPNPFRLVIDIHGSPPAKMASNPSHRVTDLSGPPARSAEVRVNRSGSHGPETPEHPQVAQTGPASERPGARPTGGGISGPDVTAAVLLPAPGLAVPSPTLTRALGLKIRRI
ncbi:MAG: AMIN domain-containing protein, partial [Terriglobia bacterium]